MKKPRRFACEAFFMQSLKPQGPDLQAGQTLL